LNLREAAYRSRTSYESKYELSRSIGVWQAIHVDVSASSVAIVRDDGIRVRKPQETMNYDGLEFDLPAWGEDGPISVYSKEIS